MSRYIDADFEIDHYTSMTTHPTPDVSEKDKRDSLIVLEALRRAKSIDIVRCRECKAYDSECEWCGGLGLGMKPDDFCSYGKVSEIPTGSEREGE